MSKRGEIEIQFNWIMILIAGAIIFGFFISIVSFANNANEQSAATTTATYLDSIFTASAVKDDTITTFGVPARRIEFSCSGYRVDRASNERLIRNKIFFAPSDIEDSQLVTWALSWDAPFRVTNLLMISSPQVRYIIRGSAGNEVYEYLLDSFPQELTPEFDPSTLSDENNFKVRFIYVDQEPSDTDAKIFHKMAANDVTALKIEAQSLEQSIAKVRFYKKSSPTISRDSTGFNEVAAYDFFGKGSLVGAIFADAHEDYKCSMDKAIARFKTVASIYEQRSSGLASFYAGDLDCSNPHGVTQVDLANLRPTLTLDNLANKLFSLTGTLKSKNELAQQSSCALIY